MKAIKVPNKIWKLTKWLKKNYKGIYVRTLVPDIKESDRNPATKDKEKARIMADRFFS